MISQRLKSKTYWLGLVVSTLGVIQMNWPEVQASLGAYAGWAYIGLGIAINIMRELTTGSLSDK